MIRIILIVLIVVVVLALILVGIILKYYKKCPAGSILVIFNNQSDGFGSQVKFIKSGGAFVWPFGGSYKIIDLKPFILQICPEKLINKEEKPYYLNAKFILAINRDENVLYKALERISGLTGEQLQQLASDMISGQLRSLFITLMSDDLDNREKINNKIYQALCEPLDNFGLELVNLDIIDLRQM